MKKMKSCIDDQRRVKRYDIPLKLSYLDPVTGYWVKSMARDICRYGLRFQVKTRMEKGAALDVKIEDPFSNSLTLIPSKARIVWGSEVVDEDDIEDAVYEIGVELVKRRLY